MRFIFNYLLPLLLPLILYLSVVWATRGGTPGWLDETPWLALLGAGAVLLALSLLAWSLFSGAPTDEVYIPPHVEDGRVVPGRTVPPDARE